ncbi:D-glucuronyl C5-epimerase [Hydra vulgaris]|uniref:heparosan-N-sulfate-glucuronate 5-epimerase n=1 Tax=Hydra vulgaris TaxID=6087 RepID=T2MIC3_HYDVU|nr:D-glucuronyl C5-epimerase [Hydra vulgaris]
MLKKVIRLLFNWKGTIYFICTFVYFWYVGMSSISPLFFYQDQVSSNSKSFLADSNGNEKIALPSFSTVHVNVNFIQKFNGLSINNELYVPFEFLKHYYEIYGTFEKVEPGDPLQFTWLNADPNVLNPNQLTFLSYSFQRNYLNFHESDVANRGRVKCICGKYEVPISTQWDKKGYYYPTQIAQYGLSHLSKHYIENQIKMDRKEYNILLKIGTVGHQRYQLYDQGLEMFIVKLKFIKLLSSFELRIVATDSNEYIMQYILDDVMIEKRNLNQIVHGLGRNVFRSEITRDLNVDLVKGLLSGKHSGDTFGIKIQKILSLDIDNVQYVKAVQFVYEDHIAKFMAAADWLLYYQDDQGGWKTNVSRIVIPEIRTDAGWYSAMGQGQAISLLCRVYFYTKDTKYLNSALRATHLFRIPSAKNGILAMLFDKYPWYEEYPTVPPLYVLNGFIYSLFGLYDLLNIASSKDAAEAQYLFYQGMNSLETVLPLFDNGHGSFYDLRHISIPGSMPNRARWQYHRVHIEQLHAIVELTKNSVVNRTLQRWIGYGWGILAKHN